MTGITESEHAQEILTNEEKLKNIPVKQMQGEEESNSQGKGLPREFSSSVIMTARRCQMLSVIGMTSHATLVTLKDL